MFPTPVHLHYTYASCGQFPHVTILYADPIELDGCTAPKKNALNSTPEPGWVARRTHLSFSPNTIIEAVRLRQASVDEQLH
jgi:hypothetical protein